MEQRIQAEYMEPRIQAEYLVVDNVKTLWQKLASALKSKLMLSNFEIRDDLWSTKLWDCRDVDNAESRMDSTVKDYNPCARPSISDTDAADTDTAKTISQMSEQKDIFNLLWGIPRNDKWTVIWSSWWTKILRWLPPQMRLSRSMFKKKLQSWERMGSVRKLCSLLRRVVMAVY